MQLDLDAIGFTIAHGVAAYVGIVVLLRVSGKRTISKWNQFDFLITIAFGSVLATVMMDPKVGIPQGIIALGLLVVLQFVVTWASVRFGWVSEAVKGDATLLALDGEFIDEALKSERITVGEALASIREHGFSGVGEVHAVVFETDGTVSVIEKAGEDRSALIRLPGYAERVTQERERG